MPASSSNIANNANDATSSSSEPSQLLLLTNEPHCQIDPTSHPLDNRGRPIENEYEIMPRYTNCPPFIADQREDDDVDTSSTIGVPLYGLPIPLEAATDHDLVSSLDGNRKQKQNKFYMGQLAYYTNMGPLATATAAAAKESASFNSQDVDTSENHHDHVQTAIIGIHGSGRDAGSYLCALMGAVAKRTADAPAEELNTSTKVGKDLTRMSEGGVSSMSRNLHGNRNRLRRNLGGEDTESRGGSSKGQKGDTNEEEGEKDVLVIAPWFLAPEDGQPKANDSPSSSASSASLGSDLHTDLPFLQWVDDAPIAHTFRYGAESIGVPIIRDGTNKDSGEVRGTKEDDEGDSARDATISSYGAMDVLLETLCNKKNYPNLQKIVVVGHSAGGQFVHRWGLTSNSWCFGDSSVGDDGGSSSDIHGDGTKGVSNALREEEKNLPSIRLLPANPRSYAYLNGRRYLPKNNNLASSTKEANGNSMPLVEGQDKGGGESSSSSATLTPFDQLEYRVPNESEMNDCMEYNQYCWGLQDNPKLPTPYVSNNIRQLVRSPSQRKSSTTATSPLLAEEEDDQEEDIIDISTVLFTRYATRNLIYLSGERDTKHLGNQICHEDGYQGPSRRERSERFYQSLQLLGEEVWNMMCLGGDDSSDDTLARHGEQVEREEGHLSVEEKGSSQATKKFCSRERSNHDDGNGAEDEKYEMKVHDRSVVKNVGHDHALIFQSDEGREKIFG